MLVNTAEIRDRIQSEIEDHLAKAALLQEKLALLGQVESLANEVGAKTGDRSQKAAAAHPKQEAKKDPKPDKSDSKSDLRLDGSNAVPAPTEQSIPEMPQAAKEGAANNGKNLWACMQQGVQAYTAGKHDKALELFREARDLNPGGFEKTWSTMTSIPTYSSVARDKDFIEGLFESK
jgi:hypothetical protein